MDISSSKWEEIKESIRIDYEISDLAYKTWIEPLKLGEIKNNTVYLEVPKELAQSIFIIKKKYHQAFKMMINETLGKSFDDQYEIDIIPEIPKFFHGLIIIRIFVRFHGMKAKRLLSFN